MRKILLILCLVMMLFCVSPALSVLAAESVDNSMGEPSNVTITVVLPEPMVEPAEEPTRTESAPPAPLRVYPSDVMDIRDGNGWQIVKTYSLNAGENPDGIPRDGFERSGWAFSLTDIIRHETATAETREHTETLTLDTDTKELEAILPLLSPTMEHTADDGFTGLLALDVASIKVETAGMKTSSYTMSVTREYPRLSASDANLIPKTVTDRGTIYTLAGVDWQAGNTVTVDYEALPEYYTAVAAYTATGTSTKPTGYVITALYTGTLARLSQGRTVYTAHFLGEEIRTPLEMMTPSPTHAATQTTTPTPLPADWQTPVQAALMPASVNASEPEISLIDGETSRLISSAAEMSESVPGTTETAEPASGATETNTVPDIQDETPQTGGEANGSAGSSGAGAWLAVILLTGILAGGAYYYIGRKVNHNEKTNPSVSDVAAADGDGNPDDGDGGSPGFGV